jgi:hypothetical protein
MPKSVMLMNPDPQTGPSLLERVDLALASTLVGAVGQAEPLASAQRVLDGLRRPGPSDAAFLASVLRLRGIVVDEADAVAAIGRTPGRLSPITQEHRLLCGLHDCLRLLRVRAAEGSPPDGWFLVELFKVMTAELPRFRNNEVRRGPPWDAVLWVTYPATDELRYVLDTFDAVHHYRDHRAVWGSHHPVRQGFRLMWRFARIAPFPDFNLVMAWLALNAWLQAKGYPLLAADPGDQALLTRLVSGPPPTKIVQLEARLLAAVDEQRHAG